MFVLIELQFMEVKGISTSSKTSQRETEEKPPGETRTTPGGRKQSLILGGEEGDRRHTHTQRTKKPGVCLCAHNASLRPAKRRKWEKYAWVSQVTGLRGHIIDPFGGKMTGL